MQCVGGYKDEEEFKLKRRYLRGGEYIYRDCYCKNCSKLYNREYQRIYKARKVAEAYLKGCNDRAQEEIEMAIDRVKIAEKREKQIKELEERIKIYALNGDNIKLELYIKNNYIPTSLIKEKIEELNKEKQEAQNSISDEEREEYSDANISYILMDIETRRRCYEELLEKEK